MLNDEKDPYFHDTMLKSLPPSPPPRSSMLDITNLLCQNEFDDDLPKTPSLSAPSSPIHTSRKPCLPPPFINLGQDSPINPRHSPYSFSSMPSSPLTPPLRQPYSSSVTSLSSFDGDDDGLPRSSPYNIQQQSIRYLYNHRLLMIMPQDNERMQDRTINLSNHSGLINMDNSNDKTAHGSLSTCYLRDDGDDEGDDDDDDDMDHQQHRIKTKRRRATKKQLQVLHRVFEHTFFPSTQVRAQLGRQLGMNPRTVQIWFQNRRQALRTKEKQKTQML
ncbi:hypothetical protein [Absidia glauca]|uniref:Homeobox domain-containing protein n=1 Tax=Absidia glauca TaxID=4829 RepID=A0A168RRY5_ABSGL|nr:hypothetical protein [Absidia glauca]